MQNNKGLFVVVEGFDGVGKTTVSKWLADKFGFQYQKSPGTKFAANRHHFDDSTIMIPERFAYYIGDCVRLSIEIDKLTSKGVNVLLDRYFLSTICYHLIFEKEYMNQFISLTSFLKKPDFLLLIKSDFDVIYERVTLRPDNLEDLKYLKREYYHDIYDTFDLIIEKQKINAVTIDSNGDMKEFQNSTSLEMDIFLNNYK